MIAIGLATLLFVKYIFFDKSGTFSTSSVPPTPSFASSKGVPPATPPMRGKPAQDTVSTAMCPFSLSETSGSPSASRHTKLTSNHMPPAANVGGSPSLPALEKLISEGVVVSASSIESKRKALPSATNSANPLPKEGSDGALTRNRSSGSLLRARSHSSPRADLALKPVAAVTMGTQTEELGCGEAPKFTVGGEEQRETPQTHSERQHPVLDLPSVPRQVDECVAILKSDVSPLSLCPMWL